METDTIDPAEVSEAISTIDGFARACLGWDDLHPKQAEIMRAVSMPDSRVVVRNANETGKTSRIATASILWHLRLYPHGQVCSTAGAWRQVAKQLIPNLKAQQLKFPTWRFLDTAIKVQGKDAYLGFSAKDQGTAQGFHGSPDEPLLFIIDEAAAVPDDIFMAAEDRCNPQRLLVMGSPLGPEGWFYEACTKHRAFYQQFSIRQTECLKSQGYWLDDATIDRKIAKWGREHPIVLSSVFADFAETVEGALLSLRDVEMCIEDPPRPIGGDRHVFLDFAAGGDENAIGLREGNRVRIVKAWREQNTMAAVGQFLRELNKLKADINLKDWEVEGDADGLGKPMVDAIREAGWNIGAFHGNAAPLYDSTYANRTAEGWCETAKKIQRREIILERDETLTGQLVNRKTSMNSKGKIILESKDDLAKRGITSPDRADTITQVCLPCPAMRSISTSGRARGTPLQEALENLETAEQSRKYRGFYAG